jgi:hypothetical protein
LLKGGNLIIMGFLENIVIKKLKNDLNRNIIELCINNGNELYNHFSRLNNQNIQKNNNSKINNEIIDYLIKETEKFNQGNGIKIILRILEKQNIDINFVEKIIKENIDDKLTILNKKIKRTNKISLILIIIGMILIGITQVFQFFEKRYSFNELIIVMSWVFMWKAIELIFFERFKLMKEKRILIKIYYSEIIME